jgi:hypothetical protein
LTLDNKLLSIRISLLGNIEVFTLQQMFDMDDFRKPRLYKHLTSIPAAFLAVRQDPKDDGELVRKLFKQYVEEQRVLQRMPKDLADLFQTADVTPIQAGERPSSALT